MIYLNGDVLVKKRYQQENFVPYKGNMCNTLLVIEDVVDFSKKNPDNHLCICKCLRCGKVFPRLITIAQIRKKMVHCYCTNKADARYKFRDKRGKMLKFLIGERNKAKSEEVFVEDMERVYMFDMLIKFIESKSLDGYFKKGLDL